MLLRWQYSPVCCCNQLFPVVFYCTQLLDRQMLGDRIQGVGHLTIDENLLKLELWRTLVCNLAGVFSNHRGCPNPGNQQSTSFDDMGKRLYDEPGECGVDEFKVVPSKCTITKHQQIVSVF